MPALPALLELLGTVPNAPPLPHAPTDTSSMLLQDNASLQLPPAAPMQSGTVLLAAAPQAILSSTDNASNVHLEPPSTAVNAPAPPSSTVPSLAVPTRSTPTELASAMLDSTTSTGNAWLALLILNGTENTAFATIVIPLNGASEGPTPAFPMGRAVVRADTCQSMAFAQLPPNETLIIHNLFLDYSLIHYLKTISL